MTALATRPSDRRVHDEPVTRPKPLARIAGGLYLLLAVLGGLAQLYVRPRAIVPGDAAAPARQPARRRRDGDLRRGRRRDITSSVVKLVACRRGCDDGQAHQGHQPDPAAAFRQRRDDPGRTRRAGRGHPPDHHRDREGRYFPPLEVAFQIARVIDAPLDEVFQYPNGGD